MDAITKLKKRQDNINLRLDFIERALRAGVPVVDAARIELEAAQKAVENWRPLPCPLSSRLNRWEYETYRYHYRRQWERYYVLRQKEEAATDVFARFCVAKKDRV